MSRVFVAANVSPNQNEIDTSTSDPINSLSELTVAAWVYPTSESGLNTIGWKDATAGPLLGLDGGVYLVGQVSAATSSIAISTSGIIPALNTWSHVAMTFSLSGDKKVHLYLNGTEVTYTEETTAAGPITDDSAAGWMIGNASSGTNPFDGQIAEFVEYNVALTAIQIAALAASTTGATVVLPANIVGYWHLNGTASPEPDSSGNGNAGVLSTNPPTKGANSPGYTPPSGMSPFVTQMGSYHFRRTDIKTTIAGVPNN